MFSVSLNQYYWRNISTIEVISSRQLLSFLAYLYLNIEIN
jgi:hypothetical protein